MKYVDGNDNVKKFNCPICDSGNVQYLSEWIEMTDGDDVDAVECDDCGATSLLYDDSDEWSEEYDVLE